MAQPFSVFVMAQFMKGLPKELEESAMIDGATRFRTFFQRYFIEGAVGSAVKG
jgi:ABC-type glycerol-3-phosphate transport system permease component